MTNRPMHLYIRGQDFHTYLCLSHNTDFHMGQRRVLPLDPVVRTQFGCETAYISENSIDLGLECYKYSRTCLYKTKG